MLLENVTTILVMQHFERSTMPFWEKEKNQEDRPEQGEVSEKEVAARSNNTVVDKKADLKKKVIEKECEEESRQVEILRRMRKDPSWNLAVETLLLCEKNPSDAESIATSIVNRRTKRRPRSSKRRYFR